MTFKNTGHNNELNLSFLSRLPRLVRLVPLNMYGPRDFLILVHTYRHRHTPTPPRSFWHSLQDRRLEKILGEWVDNLWFEGLVFIEYKGET